MGSPMLICVFFQLWKTRHGVLTIGETLALGLPYALDTLLLASVYQAMSKYVSD